MSDAGEVDLQRIPEPPPPEPPRRPILPWVLGGVLAGAVIFAAYVVFWDRGRRSPAVAETEVAAGPTQVPDAGAEQIDVPPLDQTDALVRSLVGMLSTHPGVAAWLATDDLIRNFVLVVENIAAGATPARHAQALAPAGRFAVAPRGGGLYMDPRSYARYDALADAVASVDAAGAARVYQILEPRIEEAHRERGFADTSFDRTLQRAIGRLLDTPLPPDEIALVPRVAGYAFADAELEALSGAQKQLLRMGPRNVQIIQDKLRELARTTNPKP
jgi:hypothetical protein